MAGGTEGQMSSRVRRLDGQTGQDRSILLSVNIQPTLHVKHLLCAGPCARRWGGCAEQSRCGPRLVLGGLESRCRQTLRPSLEHHREVWGRDRGEGWGEEEVLWAEGAAGPKP